VKIHKRCVHCGDMLPGWHPWHQLWGECADCREWQRWLWRQRPPVLRHDVVLPRKVAEALEEGEV
jgi:hypothetical protein